MPDYMFQLESRFSPEQRAAMVRIQELAAEFECAHELRKSQPRKEKRKR